MYSKTSPVSSRRSGQERPRTSSFLSVAKDYEDYDHYWRERANVLFFAARLNEQEHACGAGDERFQQGFIDAVVAYERALAMGDDPWDKALLADALLHAGRFAEALTTFEEYLATADADDPANYEWRLKALVLPDIVHKRGLATQVRRLKEAETLAGRPLQGASPAETRRICEEALELDAASPLAWFNQGMAFNEESRGPEATLAFLAAGLFSYFDFQAWSYAFFGYAMEGRTDLLLAILDTGEKLSRGQVLKTIRDLVDEQDQHFPRTAFREMLAALVTELSPETGGGFQLRLLEGDGKVVGLQLPDATHREVASQMTGLHEAGRNQPCPCGSGLKLKRCHGS